jgi:hypothetical protein
MPREARQGRALKTAVAAFRCQRGAQCAERRTSWSRQPYVGQLNGKTFIPVTRSMSSTISCAVLFGIPSTLTACFP